MYKKKYFKYKFKYLNLLNQYGNAKHTNNNTLSKSDMLQKYKLDMLQKYKSDMLNIKENENDILVRKKISNLFDIYVDNIDLLQEKIKDIVNLDAFQSITYNICNYKIKCKQSGKFNVIMSFAKHHNLPEYKLSKLNIIDKKYIYYTFIITNKGYSFSEVNDMLELGHSHINLINNNSEKTIIAGEIKIDNITKKLYYNFASGSFSYQIRNNYKTYYYNMLHIFQALCNIIFLYETNFNFEIIYLDPDDKINNPSGNPLLYFRGEIDSDTSKMICNNDFDKKIAFKLEFEEKDFESKSCHGSMIEMIKDNDFKKIHQEIFNYINGVYKNPKLELPENLKQYLLCK
jgi:hypothetical protein